MTKKKLKKYNENIDVKLPEKKEPISSGVACDEKNCPGEMMIQVPEVWHPQLKELRRAVCSDCGWKGWV